MIGRTIPIAMLHHVSNKASWDSLRPYVIREDTFTRFLDAIQFMGRRTTTFRDLHEGAPPTRRDVILTFDDCGKHLLDFAVPELVQRKMTAVFYMPTADIGGHNSWNVAKGKSKVELMNEADLRNLETAGMEVGSHSHDHIHLDREDEEQVQYQLQKSQEILTDVLGRPAVSMAYPYGGIPHSFNDLSEFGYHHACSIFSERPSSWSRRRFIVHDDDSNWSLRCKLHRTYGLYRSWSDSRSGQTAS